MKDQIQKLIAEGRTEEALALLAQFSSDALLLQARYSNGKKQYNMGLIEFSEWQRTQAQINYAALELANTVKDGGTPAPAPVANSTGAATPAKPASGLKAFISYNHGDGEMALKVRDFLEKNAIDVIIDQEDMDAGKSIMSFIQESIKNSDAVVSVVSGKSLQSGWVGQESIASMYAVWLADKKFIPVKLDDVAFDIDFQIAAQQNLVNKIKEMKGKIKMLEKLGGDSRAFQDDLNRMNELKNNLGQIIQRLKSVLMLDITGANFEPNMQKVLASINKQ